MIPPEEQRHVSSGPRPGEKPTAVALTDVVAEGADPQVILGRCREVLMTILDYPESAWPGSEEWARLLPAWFVAASSPQQTRAETEEWLARWRSLSPADKARAESEQPWTLDDWLFWMNPAERTWYWWDAAVQPDGRLRVVVEIPGWPTSYGSLEWLIRAAGATPVIQDAASALS